MLRGGGLLKPQRAKLGLVMDKLSEFVTLKPPLFRFLACIYVVVVLIIERVYNFTVHSTFISFQILIERRH